MLRLLFALLFGLCFYSVPYAQTHPCAFIRQADVPGLKAAIQQRGLFHASFLQLKAEVDPWLGKEIDVPIPKDPAGGYTHDQHKRNYMLMFHSSLLYQLTQDQRYAILVKQLLLQYAALNPTLGNHPKATSKSPGRIFWQALNDANWMVYTGLAYDGIQSFLNPEERKIICAGAFQPEVDFMTKDMAWWFDQLHNHSVWATAGVGIIGIATDRPDYVQMALYGSRLDRKRGFVALMDSLFSPDGYYTEGPYYVRYAILPYMLFANALKQGAHPFDAFAHRQKILLQALETCLQLTNIDGRFYPMNDAIKDKDVTTNELVTAVSIAWQRYGSSATLLAAALLQPRVLIHPGGAALASAKQRAKRSPVSLPYKSLQRGDGISGKEGGVTVLRSGRDRSLLSTIFKYTRHGLSHGHYDKLNINVFHRGQEILTDYGSARFIGIEQKYGGRYLPENGRYAMQTIAHNTVVFNEGSHYRGNEEWSERFHGHHFYTNLSDDRCLVSSATDSSAYSGVTLHRTLYQLQWKDRDPLLIDVFNTYSDSTHQVDLPFHYQGQFIQSSFSYRHADSSMVALGKHAGYEFLWKEAEAPLSDSLAQFTFLQHGKFYTISSRLDQPTTAFFVRSGAHDPAFNLRRDPALVYRQTGKNIAWINVLEPHGNHDPVLEFATDAYSSVTRINRILQTKAYSILEIEVAKVGKILILQSNLDNRIGQKHTCEVNGKIYAWSGPYQVRLGDQVFQMQAPRNIK